ncbi:DUF3017 domain-containing protein [Actinomadura alba]|uniref:DUF3017 domain-containing protein n=1 Tax=Actinomadura alba TaxID=406431 RepID=UPI001C9D469A|nr:DUF3017 domain-containing protein [Actinomadura alba]
MAQIRRQRRTGPKARGGAPRWLGQLPYLFVLSGTFAGLALVAMRHPKRGSVLVAAAVLLGALARLVLPESQVGLLATRKRWTDVLILVVFAIGIAVTAYVVPPPR